MDTISIILLIILIPLLIALFITVKQISNLKTKITKLTCDNQKIENADNYAEKTIQDAKKQSEIYLKEIEIKAKQLELELREKANSEIKERRNEISVQENRLFQKEEQLNKKEIKLENELEKIENEIFKLAEKEKELELLKKEENIKLEEIAELTKEEAKQIILNNLEEKLINEKAKLITKYEESLNDSKNKLAKEILSNAIQRCVADHTSESTISVVSIPSDEMKGRIIGKEGRNIKSLEILTGVQFIIDDTPESITISAFDPIRREVARLALEKLMADGRIQPARIEEMVEKAIEEIDEVIKEAGNSAMEEAGLNDLHPEIIKHLGKLKFRTSYGQNVLLHSVEVANIAGILAKLVGADVKLAIRGGLLHDIGKSLDHDPEIVGTHVELGIDLLKQCGENNLVLNAVEAHHGAVEPCCVESILVQSADAISASRPGARRDSFEAYIKRLEHLENIAKSEKGVKKAYAIQAGREVRLILDPSKVSDDEMKVIAHSVSEKIENEVAFPGNIKVIVIREKREVDYAKKSKVNIKV